MAAIKNQTMVFISILVVICLILVGIFAYYETIKEKDEIVEEEVEQEIDDRISPLENQGLITEVLRIRHRGLLDKLMTRGLGWREKPSFYYIVKMDELEYISKDVHALSGGSEILFNGWDTMFQENKFVKWIEDGQPTSEVTLTIIEREKSGLFGRKSKDIEKEKISLTFDYRTGRWIGDDSFKDYDGYGHYVGETFEVWFNLYMPDYDQDAIPYWMEVNAWGTNPKVDDSYLDPDGDGVPSAWEMKWGYDPLVWDDHRNLDPDIDGIDNVEEYKVEKYLSDPFSRDIYVEVDGMKKGGIFDPAHVLWEESAQAIIERYAEHNVKLYFDFGWPGGPINGGGELLRHYKTISQDSGMVLQFYKHHFPDERKGIFRYVIIAHESAFNHPAEYLRYDVISVDTGIKKMLLTKKVKSPREARFTLAAQLMHELGHSVGINPWSFEGCDNISAFSKGDARKEYASKYGDNYQSVMDYFNLYDRNLLDYSHGSNGPPYDQNDWLKLYVPSFQVNSECVEDPTAVPPDYELTDLNFNALERLEFGMETWEYAEELSLEFNKETNGWYPTSPQTVNWRIYKRTTDDYQSDRNLRIYAQPKDVPYADYYLIYEGYLNSDAEIQLV